jgi:hypothetical protein
MLKIFAFFIIILPLGCFAQVTISGRILNQADTKPVANASVFLSNSSTGTKTNSDGAFILQNVTPGKYDLIISIIGFETYRQSIMVSGSHITLPAILIFPKTILLNEVKIRPKNDPDRYKYYEWFKDEFLGTSVLASECKILNPDIIDLDYDKKTSTLTASVSDFLEIENDALGYKIKYLLTDFKLSNKAGYTEKVHYEGSALFEEMKGSPVQLKRWKKRRQEVYEGSPMHFLRSVINDETDSTDLQLFNLEGFLALRLAAYPNPERPSDSLLDAKIKYYKKLKEKSADMLDSLSWWTKKAKLPKTLNKLLPKPLHREDIIKPTDQQGLFALELTRDIYSLYINYNKNRFAHFHSGKVSIDKFPFIIPSTNNLSAPQNTESTLVNFNTRYALFDKNGGLVNPNSLTYSGVWARLRVAELLPLDYSTVTDNNKIADNIIAKLNNFTTTHSPEKAYLHFDKPYYAAGDTLYFKAYVTRGESHSLSNLSGVLHVDLINTNNKIDQSMKLQLDSGLAWGDFALPDSLPKGNYRVRGYTRWMRNDGENAFFDQIIPVGSILNNKIPESGNLTSPLPSAKPDIQFLPEGGNLVAGVPSKIAFKAINTNGLGVEAKGVVVDNENRQVCSFASSYLGMGYFYLNPADGKTYRAKITYADGTQNTVDLPKVGTSGITLSVNSDSLSKAWIKIQAGKAYYQENRDKDFFVVISSGDVNTKIICPLDSAVISMDLLKRHLRTGIARFTLFSPNGEPLSERLVFVQNDDQLNLHISSDKPEYNKRGKVHIKLNAINTSGDPVAGHFSVSVTDESKVPVDKKTENTILTNLLLTSDLKGYVEQPDYYFTDTAATARRNLDVLMLTQGYSRFEWKQILGNNGQPLLYQPEKGLEISGIAKTLGGKPLDSGVASLISPLGGPALSRFTDNKGNFRFDSLAFTDTARFILSAVNAKGKNNTQITYKGEPEPEIPIKDSRKGSPDVSVIMRGYLENNEKQQEELNKYGSPKGRMLKEVKIKSTKLEPLTITPGLGVADQVVDGNNISYGGGLAVKLMGALRGVTLIQVGIDHHLAIARTGFPPVLMGVVWNGQLMPYDFDLNLIDISSVDRVEVFKNEGVLAITTTAGRQAKNMLSIGVLPIIVKGFYKAREFYAPKYEHPADNPNFEDLRSTIYWNPEVITDKDGNASFDYYNADGTGNYRVVIEGIDESGNLGRQVYRYRVSD